MFALAGFVLTAVAGRFAFPSVSMEGSAFWLIRSAPVSLRAFLWIKFAIYLLPLLVLSETLIVASNLLLRVTPFMMYLSTATIFFPDTRRGGARCRIGGCLSGFCLRKPGPIRDQHGGIDLLWWLRLH